MHTDSSYHTSDRSAEEQHLRDLADHDWLTGLFNRRAVERFFHELSADGTQGIVFLISVSNLGRLNNRYGHLIGDYILKETARILGFMFSHKELIGRLEGNEFFVFSPGSDSDERMEARILQLKSRFRSVTLPDGHSCRLSVSISGEPLRPGDTYHTLMKRIDSDRLKGQENLSVPEIPAVSESHTPPGVVMDLKHIQHELSEQELLTGAYCQDYDNFKNIYRFVARGLHRSGREAFTILITLADGDGTFISLSCRESQMKLLGTVIQNCLRIGDVYTQYSSCQYLVMVLDASAENANMIGLRIRDAFLESTDIPDRFCLLHAVYPLEGINAK